MIVKIPWLLICGWLDVDIDKRLCCWLIDWCGCCWLIDCCCTDNSDDVDTRVMGEDIFEFATVIEDDTVK